MSNKKTHITLSFVKGLIKQLSDPYADESLKAVSYTHLTLPTNREV